MSNRKLMGVPYRARTDERHFLNLPGFHGGAYVVAYVEDTTSRGPLTCAKRQRNFEPRMILEIADCTNRVNLEFDLDSMARRENSLHKLDVLIATLCRFRSGLIAEFDQYDRRQSELDRR